jgi:transposase-like protein
MTERIVKRYSMAFKRQVVQEYEAGASMEGLRRKYGISGKQTVRNWIDQYGRTGVRHQIMEIEDADVQAEKQVLQARIANLEKLVAQLSLDKLMLESTLVVAEKELGYPVKKKRAPKSSRKRSRRENGAGSG